jgi:hypothetical protein
MPMNSLRSFNRWSTLFILIVLFAMGTALTYLTARDHARTEGQFTLSHLSYVLKVKDDLGLIDWANSFENSTGGLAYDIRVEGKSRISGGNKTMLPNTLSPGFHFQLPSQWVWFGADPEIHADVILVFESEPSPWVGGLLFMGIWGMGYGFRSFRSCPEPKPRKDSMKLNSARQVMPESVLTPPNLSVEKLAGSGFHYLLLNHEFEILEASPTFSEIFPDYRAGSTIFFDLNPSKELSDLIQQGLEGQLEKAFEKNMKHAVRVRAVPKGSLLIFDPIQPDGTLQNH